MIRRGIAALFIVALAPSAVWAQAWPARSITMVVPFAAGGSIDIPARRVAAELSQKLGQQVVVENRSGANGNIGGAVVAKAEPDGYTLMFAPPGVLMTNRFMYKNMPFDADKAFAPVVLVGKSPLVLAANPQLPVHNLQQLIAYAKANSGKLNVGIPGVGAQAHLTMELLQKQAGTKMNYVPYRGASGSGADLIAGQIDLSINFTPGMMGSLQNGSLRGIAVTTTQRSKKLPDIPTVSESGFPGFESVASYSIVTPAGTPRDIVVKLNALINTYLISEQGRNDLDTLDMQPAGGTPEELRDFIAGEIAKWGPIIKAAKIEM
jgi:tripartite-type tricarboxylate transporter receptor subunit TctC